MKNILNLKKIALVAFVSILGVSCSKSDDAPTPVVVAPKSITAIATANPELSTLVKALVKAELSTTLDGTGTYTVFAPTNQAFIDQYGGGFPADAVWTKEAVTKVLLNHVLLVKKTSTELATGYVSTMAPSGITGGTTLSLFVDKTTGVKLNGFSTVKTPDIVASNGFIHIVDKVIPALSIVEQASLNKSFSTLVSILSATEQKGTLDALKGAKFDSPLIVLAPTNEAFTSALAGWAKGATQPQLTTVLQYHVVKGNAQSTSPVFVNDAPLKTFGGQNIFVVKLPSSTVLKFKDFATDNSTVLIADVQCTNGIIHAVDKVLQPDLK
jgi:uncharacterized surface protein with fasciclin (FAS1) repeats